MAIIKCKMCGGDLVLTGGSTIATCEYCGSQQTVPTADNEKKLTLFARANRLRMGCEFDKAAGVYESIVADFPEEAEAYWGLVLCKYGIEYVDDPATGNKIPTCHRSSFESIMDDSDLEQALENADLLARKQYRDEAKQIEEIRKGIIAVSANEQPYDIFICYKETDANGDRTLDSVLAQDIYDALTAKNYRVFFSRITLEDKLGVEFEPYIFAALNSAKIMLAVGTDYEYYNAVWVKNEWSRYLKLMAKDKSKHLIPCYKGIDAYDMPKEFARLQAQDLGKVGAIQDILRGIEKVLNEKPQKAPAAGMTKEEKTMVEAMGRSAKRTRLLLTSALFALAFGFVSAILVAITNFEVNPSHFWAAYYTSMGQAVFYDGYNVMIIAAYYAINSIGLAMCCVYGFRNKLTHLTNLALYITIAIVFLTFAAMRCVPGVMLIAIAIMNAIMTLIVTLAAYKETAKIRNTYCGIFALLTTIILVSCLV